MPWNDQSNNGQGPSPGGPWGSGRPPWGQPQRPQRGQGPDLEDMLRDFRERLRGLFGRGGPRRGDMGERRGPSALALIAALVATAWLASGIYVVGAGSQAVVTRFGVYDRVTGPGLHAHLPLPFEQVQIENVTQPRETKIGVDQAGNDVPQESQMLTGDKSIIEINFTVLWQIANIRDYAFNVRDPRETVKAVAESALREVVGRREFDDVITRSRSEVELATLDLMQRMLDYYQAGIRVTTVQVDQARAPAEVAEAFRDVIKAGQDQITKRNEATRYANEVVPQARGQAAAAIQDAEAYRERAVREAQGEAHRFSAVLGEYRKAPRVTRERLYLETMERVYGGADKLIIDKGAGVQPYLPLDQLRRQPAAPAAAVAPPRQATP